MLRNRKVQIAIGVLAAFAVLVIIGALTGSSGGDKQPAAKSAPTTPPSPAASRTAPATKAPTPTVTAAPQWSSGVPITDASVRTALGRAQSIIRSLDLSKPRTINIDGAYISVTYKADSALRETDLLTIGAATSYSALRALFANANVQTVTITTLADWTDQFGKTAEETATVATFDRATVAKIDWGGLKDRVESDNKALFCIADTYRIHPGIYSRLENKGCLTGAARLG